MEDCSQDNFHNYIEFNLRLLGGLGDSLAVPVQDLPLSARAGSKHCESGPINPYFSCLSNLYKDLHDNHQEHHHLWKSQNSLVVWRLVDIKDFSHHLHYQLLLHLHICLFLRLSIFKLFMRNQDYYNSEEVSPFLFRINNCDYFVSSQLLSLVLVDMATTVVGALLPFVMFKVNDYL